MYLSRSTYASHVMICMYSEVGACIDAWCCWCVCTAVDMWALGVVVVSAACARYPLLRARDDAQALAELCALLGHAAVSRAAVATRRRLLASCAAPGLCLRRLCARARGRPLPPRAHACRACRTTDCLCKDPNEDVSIPAEGLNHELYTIDH